jgi:hypothetical protein
LDRAGVFLWEVYLQDQLPKPQLIDVNDLKPLRAQMSPQLLVEARQMYEVGASLREVGANLFEVSDYTHLDSFRAALAKEFRNQGWPVRPMSATQRLCFFPPASCAGITGEGRCKRAAAQGARFCLAHDPERRQEMVMGVDRARRAQINTQLPLQPFRHWLLRRISEEGGLRALARHMGLPSCAQLSPFASGYRTVRGKRVRVLRVERSTVERLLAADGTASFEDLYGQEAKAA